METSKPERWLTCKDLADILDVEVKTIQNRLSLLKTKKDSVRPDLLPPRSYPPGVHGARWAPRVVAEWQERYNPPPANDTAPRRPGRPTKAEQVARRVSQSVANVSGVAGK